ncbi:putative quinol monooxygenase [Aquimarina longa]|uniref:putative quinol monooxygenase n=1 Tax=Aquimarina longa TaxID=1080221 RepID=UPI00078098FE|nr:hypothetical protein [Aquimarina longa]
MKTNCTVILKSITKSKYLDDLMIFLKENLPNVRNFDGCLLVEILFNHQNNSLIIYEKWESKEKHANYIEFISTNGAMEQLASFLAGPPEVSYFEKLNI